MLQRKRDRGSAKPRSSEDITVGNALFLAMKQIGLLVLLGCLVWLAHALVVRLSRENAASHDAPAKRVKTSPGEGTAPGDSHSSTTSPRDAARSPGEAKSRWVRAGGAPEGLRDGQSLAYAALAHGGPGREGRQHRSHLTHETRVRVPDETAERGGSDGR
jgi:hypothetical protein